MGKKPAPLAVCEDENGVDRYFVPGRYIPETNLLCLHCDGERITCFGQEEDYYYAFHRLFEWTARENKRHPRDELVGKFLRGLLVAKHKIETGDLVPND
jgi:hypothetical protein